MVQILSNIVAILASSALLVNALPTTIEERGIPAPKDITIESVAYGGTGCPQGSADVDLSRDGTSFSVAFSKSMSAKLNTGDLTDTRKFCQLNFDLRAPSGFQYAIVAANYTGFANLGPNARAKHTTTFYWSGESSLSSLTIPLYGPAKYVYNLQAAAVIGAEPLWSPCGCDAALNIKSDIQVYGTNTFGEITDVGAAGKITNVFSLVWRKC